MHSHTDTIGVTERALLTSNLFLETTGEVNRYHVRVEPQGPDAMNMLPENTFGNFFNTQRRNTSTYQFVQTSNRHQRDESGPASVQGRRGFRAQPLHGDEPEQFRARAADER